MSPLIIALIAAGSFLAGYLLRGWLAVMWERKRSNASVSVPPTMPPAPSLPRMRPASPGPLPAVTARPAGRAHGVKPGDGTPLGALLADPELAWLFGRQDIRHDDQET